VARGAYGLVFGSPRRHDKTRPRGRRIMIRHVHTRLDAAGMNWASSHTFRRTAATWMDEAGAPLAEIANQLGHANVNVTATYLVGGRGRAEADPSSEPVQLGR
jgi:integrase